MMTSYTFVTSINRKISVALKELALDYEVKDIDLAENI